MDMIAEKKGNYNHIILQQCLSFLVSETLFSCCKSKSHDLGDLRKFLSHQSLLALYLNEIVVRLTCV